MGREARINAASWHRVTKGYVIETFKQADCKNCNGAGHVNETVCSCASLAFRRAGDEMIAEGKLRYKQVDKSTGWFEYRKIGVAA